jgi:hypothetical protein
LEALRALNHAVLRIVDKMPENYLHLSALFARPEKEPTPRAASLT